MTSSAAPQLAPHAGPIERESSRLLAEVAGAVQAVEIAKRSPVGAGAVKAEVAGDTAQVADSLSSQDWIEAVAVRPRHLYLRVEATALRAWLTGDAGRMLPLGEGKPSESPGPKSGEAESLAAFRLEAVAEALARINTLPGAAQEDGAPVRPAVGAVDVRYGALRMRHGGVLGAEDAADELIEEMDTALLAGLDPEHFGRCALALLLLATPHRKHIQVDDTWLRQGVAEIGDLVHALRAAPRADPPVKPSEKEGEAVHLLALELNGLPKKASMAVERQEPAFLARFALSLATLVKGAPLPCTDPLRGVAAAALASSLRLLAAWPEQLLRGSEAAAAAGSSGGHRVEAQDVV